MGCIVAGDKQIDNEHHSQDDTQRQPDLVQARQETGFGELLCAGRAGSVDAVADLCSELGEHLFGHLQAGQG